MPDTQRLIAEFLNYIRVEKRLAMNTAVSYARDLRRYAAYLEKGARQAETAIRSDIQGYLSSLYA
ncbi:MAG: site-specific integrase, partial [Longimicrobiales bacterium]